MFHPSLSRTFVRGRASSANPARPMDARVVVAMVLAAIPLYAGRIETPRSDIWLTNGHVYDAEFVPGKLYVGGIIGYVGEQNASNFAILDQTTGQPTSSYPNTDNTVHAAIPDGAGGWYIGGEFETAGSVGRRGAAHVLADGSIDPVWNPDCEGGAVRALVLHSGIVYIGGEFATCGGTYVGTLAAVDTATGALVSTFNAGVAGRVNAIAIHGSRIYAGGQFYTVQTQLRDGLAAMDITTGALDANWAVPITCMAPLGAATPTKVLTLAVSGTTLYVGGYFNSVAGLNKTCVVALDAASGSVVSGFTASAHYGGSGINGVPAPAPVNALACDGSRLYVGGEFHKINGTDRWGIGAVNSTTGALESWNPSGIGRHPYTLAVDADYLYFGGYVGANESNPLRVYRKSDAQPAAVSPAPLCSIVRAVAVASGKICIGGSFVSINGANRNYAAALDLSTGAAAPWNPSLPAYVPEMEVTASGDKLFVISGSSSSTIYAYSTATDTLLWQKSATSTNKYLRTLHVDGNTLYVLGDFGAIDGVSRACGAALDINTGAVQAWNPGLDRLYNGSGGIVTSATSVYICGGFTSVGGVRRPGVAALDKITGALQPWDPHSKRSATRMRCPPWLWMASTCTFRAIRIRNLAR